MMTRFAIALLACSSLVYAADVTAESAGAPPADLDAGLSAVLQKEGVRIKEGAKTLMELWFVNVAPTGAQNSEANVSITTAPHGALMGVARFTEKGLDRRGQTMKPGLYTMRLSFFPPDGNHQGVSEQRDFLILSLASDDKDLKATPDYPALMELSLKATGTPHPAVLSVWKADPANFKAGVAKEGEHAWTLQTKVGDLAVGVIVSGTFDH